MCFECIASHSPRVSRHFVHGSCEISLVPSLHRVSTDALITKLQSSSRSLTQAMYVAMYVANYVCRSQHKPFVVPSCVSKVHRGSGSGGGI